jgi:hypothetical protein
LFRGSGPLDHNLVALQDLVLPLPHVVQEGTEYSLAYRVTEDKTVLLQARFAPNGSDAFFVNGELAIDQDTKDSTVASLELARIN